MKMPVKAGRVEESLQITVKILFPYRKKKSEEARKMDTKSIQWFQVLGKVRSSQ